MPARGELAFVFTGAAAAYPGMGGPLLRAVPGLVDRLMERFPELARAARRRRDEPGAGGRDVEHVRRFFPDQALERTVARLTTDR